MSTTSTVMSEAATTKYGDVFWERLWRLSGINFIIFFLIAAAIQGLQPLAGAPAEVVVGFCSGERTRILIAAAISSLNVLNMMWFAAALRAALTDAGQEGWGGAVTASSAAFGRCS
jgi:hypothetical protein